VVPVTDGEAMRTEALIIVDGEVLGTSLVELRSGAE